MWVFYADPKSKMDATAGHWLTLDPVGKCSNMYIMRYGEMSMRQQPQSQIVSEMPSSQKL